MNTRMFISPKWGNFNDVMQASQDQSTSLSIIPSNQKIAFELDFFYSKRKADRPQTLANKATNSATDVLTVIVCNFDCTDVPTAYTRYYYRLTGPNRRRRFWITGQLT
jgi:hypothetical protein